MNFAPAELFSDQSGDNDQRYHDIQIRRYYKTQYRSAFYQSPQRICITGALYNETEQKAEITNKSKL
jgi:hypothetical protein